VSVIEGLLARIKALFDPGRSAPPPDQAAEEPPPHRVEPAPGAPAPGAPAAPEARPVAIAPPPAEESPALVAQAPIPTAAPPPRVAEAPVVAEAPTVVAKAPAAIAEAPTEVEEAPSEETTAAIASAGGLTLRLETERGPRSTFEVTKSGATIGRGPESTIQLADLSVSRKHAKITYRQGAYWLSDLGSMGGTWLDGTKLAAPRRVATGQTIDIGVCRLTVVAAADGEKSGAAKGPSNAA
jgi:hypothetical protein